MIREMYPAKAGSPKTNLATSITAEQTTITVMDGSILMDAPNLMTIYSGSNMEVIKYEAKVGNELSDITRGLEGTARSWNAGTKCARMFTAYDHDGFKENIEENNDKINSKIQLSSFTAISDNTTNIIHDLDYDSAHDELLVIYKGLLLEKNVNYTENVNEISIDLENWNIDAGDIVFFKLYKDVHETS